MTEQSIFLAALDIADATERADFVSRICAGDAVLRQQVEELLAAHQRSGAFLDVPALQQMAANDGADPDSHIETSAEPQGVRAEINLSFLQPTTKAGSLGRLGHYEVLEVLGQGGFGIVVKALDEKLQRLVAVKVMSPQLAATSPPRKRFLREARAAAAVRHDNVVAIHAVEEQPIPYLVMEYIAGQTLQQRLDQNGPLDLREVVQIGQQIASGLEAAHTTGLIHRDIKPGNILLEQGRDRVKITDFGLARSADDASLTQSGVIAGTPLYMSPEQAQGVEIDQRSDLFSLGSVLYVMCSGRPPFRAATTLAVLKRVAEDEPRPIREIIPEVPDWLVAIITKLHAKNPAERFASAQEVADLLGRCLTDLQQRGKVEPLSGLVPVVPKVETRPVEAPAPLSSGETVRRGPRRWLVAAAAVGLVIAGLGIGEATGVTKLRGTIIRLFSPEGTLVVEVDDPDVSVSIDGEEIVITGAGAREIRLKPGQYKVVATRDGRPVRQELVTVTKNGKQVVRVSRDAEPPAITQEKPEYFALRLDQRVGVPSLKLNLSGPLTLEAFVTPETAWFPEAPGLAGFDHSGLFNLGDRWMFRWDMKEGYCEVGHGPVVKGQRVHVAGVLDDNELRLYIDGKLRGKTAIRELRQGNIHDPFRIGDTSASRLFQEIRVSNVARYRDDFTPAQRFEPDANTLALYHCDNGQGTVLKDASKNQHDGKIVDGTWVKLEAPSGSAATVVTDAWLKEVAALSPEDQLKAVTAKLKDLNPGFKDRVSLRGTEGRVVTNLEVASPGFFEQDAKLRDLSPLRALPGLRKLHLLDVPPLSDLSPLKDLKLTEFSCCRIPVSDLSPLKDMKLTAVHLQDTPVKDLSPLKDMKLTSLSFNSALVMDLKLLKGMPLIQLTCNSPMVSDLTPLENMSLTYLDCNFTRVSDLRPLKGMPLARFECHKTPVSDLTPLKAMPLVYLRCDSTQVSDLTPLQDLSSLRELWIGGPKMTDAGLAPLKKLSDLETLLITNVTDAGLDHLKGMIGLRQLRLGDTEVTDAGLIHLKGLFRLRVLELQGTRVTDAGLEHLTGLKNLTALNLSGTAVTDKGIAKLKAALPKCDINWNGVVADADRRAAEFLLSPARHAKDAVQVNDVDRWLGKPEELPNRPFRLTGIGVTWGSKLDDADLEHFRGCKHIKILNLCGTAVTKKGLVVFNECRDLRRLTLVDGTFDDTALELFKDRAPQLTFLDLRGNVSDAGLANFQGTAELDTLGLNFTRTTDKGLAYFTGNKKLKSLGLGQTAVSDAGLEHVARIPALRSISLQGTKVTEAGIKKLAAALADCRIEWNNEVIDPKFRRFDKPGNDYAKIATGRWIPLLATKQEFEKLVAQKSFATDDWPAKTVVPRLKYENGELECHRGGIVFPDLVATDAILRAKVKMVSGFHTDLRLRDHDGQFVELCFHGGGYFCVGRHRKGWKPLTMHTVPNLNNGYIELAFAAVGRKLTVYANGWKIIEAEDDIPEGSAVPAGRPGLLAAWHHGPAATGLYKDLEFQILDNLTADRRAAQYVLSIGGTVQINGVNRRLTKPSELSSEPFRLTEVNLLDNPKVTDAGLASFQGCKDVVSLDLTGTHFSDAGLAHFKDCKSLTMLALHGTSVTDAGLGVFKNCRDLTYLGLKGTKVTDAGLAHFKDCPKLKELDARGARSITDAGLAHLKDCKEMEALLLDGTKVTNAGLAHFKDHNLSKLELIGTGVTDAGLALFKDQKNLSGLKLDATDITDAGLAHLKNCKNLTHVQLVGTRVTEAGLVHLKDANLTTLWLDNTPLTDKSIDVLRDFGKLRNIGLKGTKVTEAGAKKLADALPLCTITWNGGIIEPSKK